MVDKQTGLERESLVIKGVRSELRLEGGTIHITKEATTQARPTSVTIDVKTVRGSTVETPRRGGRGWFHVATVNGSPAPVGELAASGDPFALPITARSVGACRKLAKLIDKHVKERGLPADVGPNQGRFSSGVVLSGVVKPVAAPMVTMPPEPAAESPEPAGAVEEPAAAPPRKRAVKKSASKKAPSTKAGVKKTVAKKTVAKKTASKQAGRKKAASKQAGSGKASAAGQADSGARAAVAGELVGQLRELGELHAAGVLDDAEFAAAKAKILG